MRTHRPFAKVPSTALTVLLLLGSSAEVVAAPAGAPAATPPVPTGSGPGRPDPASASPAPASEAAASPGALAEPPEPAAEAPPVTEIGLERLPASAYPEPQIRGLKYGSLWLTFHGLQWPYMPPGPKGERFVVGLSGWGWVDTAYQKFKPWGPNPTLNQSRIAYWTQEGRMLLRVTPTYSFDDWFVQGQVELVGTEDQGSPRSTVGGADTDDLWLRIGQWNKWDLQVGRFEGWEVFHLGMGLDQNTFERTGAIAQGEGAYGIQFYGLDDNQYRPQSAAGNLALHYYPFPFLRFELLGMAGSLGAGPAIATRPVAILDFGWVKLKGGTEWQRTTARMVTSPQRQTNRGIGAAVQFVFDPHVELGFNAAQGTVVAINGMGQADTQGSYTRTSFGGFANVSNGSPRHPLLFGVGGLFTRKVDQNNLFGEQDNYWLWQSFAAVQYVAFNQFYIKLVGGYSRSHFLSASANPPLVFDDEMYSLRLRFSFYF
jgi:hypothetical protein